MSFNPHRERHTIGTRLALQGLSAGEIADMLMHTDTQNCEAYVQLGIQHFQLLREILDTPMASVAANFLNEPADEADLKNLDNVLDLNRSELPVIGGGKCGSCAFRFDGSAPFACLTCPKFRVFVDADLSLLWVELHRRYAYLYDENGEFNHRYDPSQKAQFERYCQALIQIGTKQTEWHEDRKTNTKLEA